ncbi:IS3 family transposase [Clostridium sp. MB40-C1]|uniref:IS3 family transposase n=1 Tax=Clostridium sp. MB40-C1 TaxID=3070996 RepID=UPI0027DEE361|nr:IS3 family transposase [Clostridium sp. MB40-C1]WMJ79599.1 IS3 family transposase [Clostridium sp. MB40-C1]
MARKYTSDFKIQACELVINEGLKPKIVAEKFGINNIMLYRWIDEFKTYGNEAFVGRGNLRPKDAKLKKLEKENEIFKQEVEILKVSRSGLFKHKCKNKTVKELEIEQEVINCFKKHGGNYGRIHIRKALLRNDIKVTEPRITAILKKNGLYDKYGRKRKNHLKKTPAEYLSENLVKDKFVITEPNTLWCADITEIKIYKSKLYVSGIIDVASRKIVGWSIRPHMRQEIVHEAINMAYYRFNPKEDLIFHSDRGCQYTSNSTKNLLIKYKMKSSMSRPGSPNDNQPIETFWKTLKQEIKDISKLRFKEAKRAIIKYIELYYNSDRIHSSLGYKTPNEFWLEKYLWKLTVLFVYYS